ncbi:MULTISPECIES: phosphonate ABC transporter substrate-binding protein [unclassified Agarivorans]|uniref:phosphonate ABC transporter substrate-binding protein n=1 Tax=unclassified Agarivorans TaxID=2636026 RepID=UPI0026E2CD2A|nr:MULTISPECIES: phosphonate ABC transporter substrate-binding protein [unclassified Agarivorans]MDO6688078.1 phosphonate ABC transporter substrate-binding protein [Agarivorans sp. 3_MG-2023]MDO6717673.1 phosphonate ABC transporter substrate-binding protein [Agarivorans sp. 2_MG-2023]
MLKLIKQTAFATAVVAAAVSSTMVSAAEKAMDTINFGIISTESQQNLKTTWTPFLEAMEEKTGFKVKAFFAPDYAGIIQGMRFDKVDVAWYGNKSAMEAVDRAGGEIFAQTVDASGNPGYWSVLVTHKDSPLNTLEDVITKRSELTFGNGDPNSTSGFLVPSYYVFAQNNISVSDFKRSMNSGHEANALAAAAKQVDVATGNTENMDRLEITAPKKFEQLKVIWKSPLIPSDPIVWRKNLPESVKGEVYDFFMEYGTSGDAKELAVLEALQWAPFKASSDLQLLPIRQLVLFKNRIVTENDSKMSKAEKAAELAVIDAQLADLNRKQSAITAMAK